MDFFQSLSDNWFGILVFGILFCCIISAIGEAVVDCIHAWHGTQPDNEE